MTVLLETLYIMYTIIVYDFQKKVAGIGARVDD